MTGRPTTVTGWVCCGSVTLIERVCVHAANELRSRTVGEHSLAAAAAGRHAGGFRGAPHVAVVPTHACISPVTMASLNCFVTAQLSRRAPQGSARALSRRCGGLPRLPAATCRSSPKEVDTTAPLPADSAANSSAAAASPAAAPAPAAADSLAPDRLKQLRRDGMALKDVIKMGRRGVAEGLTKQIQQRWNTSEVRRQAG